MRLKVGYVGVVGLPNAGKSTLANQLIGEKVSIISSKAQTTRQKVLGILTQEDAQMIFIDAPGFIKSNEGINKFLQQEWEGVLKESDVLLGVLNLDAKSEQSLDDVLKTLSHFKKEKFIFINKMDLLKPERLFLLEQKLRDYNLEYLFGTATKIKPELKDQLIGELKKRLPDADHFLFEPDLYTSQTLREMCEELIRESAFVRVGQEVPYQLAVKIRSFKEEPALTRIHADLIVTHARYKKILVGSGGAKIKKIGTDARKKMEKLLDQKVYLELMVKVRDSWTQNKTLLKEYGYDGNKK